MAIIRKKYKWFLKAAPFFLAIMLGIAPEMGYCATLTINPDAITAGTWTDEGGAALTATKINDASDATYAKTSTDGATFQTSFNDDPAYIGATINSVTVWVRAKTVGNETLYWGPYIGGAPYEGAVQALTTTLTDYSRQWTNNPAGGAWTPAAIDGLEVRLRMVRAGATSEVDASKVWVIVDYTPLEVSSFTVVDPGTGGTLNLSWTNPSYTGFAGVKIVRDTGPPMVGCESGTTVYDNSGTSYSDTTGLSDGVTYYYLACTYDTDGVAGAPIFYSDGSAGSGTPTMVEVSGFTVVNPGTGGTLNLSWTNPSYIGFDKVKIVRDTGPPIVGCESGTTVYDNSGTSYSDTGLSDGVTYYYLACTYDTDGVAGAPIFYSDGSAGSGTPTDTTAPGDVTGLSVVNPGTGGALDLSWTNPGDADLAGIRIVWQTTASPSNCTDGTTIDLGVLTSYNHTGLTNGILHYYRVCAFDEVPNYAGGTTGSGTPTSGAATTTVGDGVSPSNKYVKESDVNKAISAFTLQTSSGTDGVTAIEVTGTNMANVATVYIYEDVNADSEYDVGDTSKGSLALPTSPASISVAGVTATTTFKRYLIVYDFKSSLPDAQTLTAYVSTITSTNTKTYSDNADATITIDSAAPSYTWVSPGTGLYYADGSSIAVEVTIGETGSGITNGAACNAKIDGATPFTGTATYATATGKCTGTLTLNNPSGLTDGAKSLTVQVADIVGNSIVSSSRTISIDNTAPDTTDDVSVNWVANEITITLTPNDFGGSGVDYATGIYGCFGGGCNPVVLGTNQMTTSCGNGNECNQQVRYYSKDRALNVGNTEAATYSINNSRVDRKAPTDGASLTATPGDTQCTLSWPAATDGGSGLSTSDAYKLVFLTGGTLPDVKCTTGTDLAGVTTGTSYVHNSPPLTNGTEYDYRVCAIDAVGNVSNGITATCTPQAQVVTANSSGTQTVNLSEGSSAQYIGAAFTFQQNVGTADTITDLTISEIDNVNANLYLTNVRVFYESGLASCVYNADESSINTSFDASDEIVLSGATIPVTLSPNYTCVYVVFDVPASPENGKKIDLQITSNAKFMLSGGSTKAGTYPVNLSGLTTIQDSTAPGNVTGLSVTPNAVGNRLDLAWTNPGDADLAGIRIAWKTTTLPSNCTDGTTIDLGVVTSYNHTSLTDGTLHYYRVCARDEVPNYSIGATGNGTPADSTAPGNVTGLSVTPNAVGNRLDLAWTNPGDADYAGVRIRRATGGTPANCASGTQVADVTTPTSTYDDTGLADGTAYYYRLCSYDEVPNYSTGTTGSGTTVANKLTIVSNTATVNSAIQITAYANFTGDANGGSSTEFQYDTDGGSPGTTACLSVTGASARSCVISPPLTGNTNYYIHIDHTDADGVIGTDPATIGPYLTYPGAPTMAAFSGVSETTMTVNWTAPTGGAASYKIERCTGTGCSGFSQIGTSGTTSYNDSGLTCNTLYRYRVRGTNATGNGNYSDTGEQTTSACPVSGDPPNAVTSLAVNSQAPTSLILKWTAPYDEPASNEGKAVLYDFRFADAAGYPSDMTTTYFNDNWATLLQVGREPVPLSGGSTQYFRLYCEAKTGNNALCKAGSGKRQLWSNTLYYFAMKSTDDDPQTSAVSNVTKAAILSPLPPPDTKPSHTAVRYYNIIGIPCNASVSLGAILGDDVPGSFLQQWNSISNGIDDAPGGVSPMGSWASVSFSDTPQPGRGYYLNSLNQTAVLDLADGQCGADDNYAAVPLEIGWNTIANPYLKNVTSLGANTWVCRNPATFDPSTGCSGGAGDVKTLADAITANWISNGFYYLQEAYLFETYDDVNNPAVLRPWWGQRIYMKVGPSDPDGSYIFVIKKPPI